MTSRRTFRRAAAMVASIAVVGALVMTAPGIAFVSAFDRQAVDRQVGAFLDSSGVPGAAYAVVEDGEIVHLAAQGSAGPDGRPMTPQTPVVIGSVGKSLTALAIRQLVEAGRIEPDAPVTRYLPWFSLAGPAGAAVAVTIESLVGHTSGLSTADGQDPRWYVSGLSGEDVVRGLRSVRVDRAAGSYEYSNLNYVVLGVVVEAVTGETYGDYLRRHVFEPLGMSRSAATPASANAAGIVQGHRYVFGFPVPFDEPYPTGMVAAGYQVSTAEDMARFVGALANGGVAYGIDIVAPRRAPDPGRVYGTDWRDLVAVDAGTSIGQSGSTLTSNADILEWPSGRLGVVVLLDANPTQLLGLPAGAADLALDLLRLTNGEPALATAPTVRTVYLVADGVLLVLVAIFLVHLVRATSWGRRLAQATHRRRFLARSVVADGVLPLGVLVGVPLLIGATGSSRQGDLIAGWRFAMWTLPDLAWPVFLLAVGALALGLVKVTVLARNQPDRPAASRSRPATSSSIA